MIKDNFVCVLANAFEAFFVYQLVTVKYSENDTKISVDVCERISAITWQQGQYPSEIAFYFLTLLEKRCLATFPVVDVPP